MLFQVARISEMLGHLLVMSAYWKDRRRSETTQGIISTARYQGEVAPYSMPGEVQKRSPYLLLRSLSPDF